jgi:pSer/pThr/pTyr-binding forkhead associated (FHA) protein
MASIIIASGKQAGTYYPLGHRTTVIGRAESLLIQILDDQISRKHLQIRYDEKAARYLALDMHSTNGVFINGRKISEEMVLADCDAIVIGNTSLMFTDRDFADAESALHYFKKAGERIKSTIVVPRPPSPGT